MRLGAPAALAAALLALPPVAFSQAPPPKVGGSEVAAPKRTKFVRPEYPAEAQAQGLRGIVILELVIDEAGKVASANVIRSVPPFDEAALAAARQWEYEVTKVDGRPVQVRLTVPITFALPLPQVAREDGIPELRQGVSPGFPADAQGPARVTAEVKLHPDGSVAEVQIKSGESPWAEVLLGALRTWRFASEGAGALGFEIQADWPRSGSAAPRVDMRLFNPRPLEASASPMPATASPEPPAPPAPVEPPPTPGEPTVPATTPTPAPGPSAPAPTPAPGSTASAADPNPQASGPIAQGPGSTPPPPGSTPPSSGAPLPPKPEPTPPPVEIISGGASPAPPPVRTEPGFSTVRDITLGVGVPDLTKGRRPIVPPVARMARTGGRVDVDFAVDAAGSVSVQEVAGTDLLKDAARQTVGSWVFRRTSAERLYLHAVLVYEGENAKAEVTTR